LVAALTPGFELAHTDKEMLVIAVEFRIAPEWVSEFEAAIVANARESLRTEPGCRQFDVCRDRHDPSLFFLYELYDDDAAFAAHLRAPHFLQMDAQTREWVRSKSVRRLDLLRA
jgi:(4S)-4-hydroxy-5-phosphonooxypentane-2,3-dione isomerase